VVESAFVVAGANEAEARPAMAMNRADMRMAAFIFGNLSDSENQGQLLPFGGSSYVMDNNKSIKFM
jgi:hypothetical protein